MERSKQYEMIGKIMHAMDERGMFKNDTERVNKIDVLTDSSYIRIRSL